MVGFFEKGKEEKPAMSSVFEKTGHVSVSAEFAPIIFTPL